MSLPRESSSVHTGPDRIKHKTTLRNTQTLIDTLTHTHIHTHIQCFGSQYISNSEGHIIMTSY